VAEVYTLPSAVSFISALTNMYESSNEYLLSIYSGRSWLVLRACLADIYYRRWTEVDGRHVGNDVVFTKARGRCRRACSALWSGGWFSCASRAAKMLFSSLFRDSGSVRVVAHAQRASLLLLNDDRAPAAVVDDGVSRTSGVNFTHLINRTWSTGSISRHVMKSIYQCW